MISGLRVVPFVGGLVAMPVAYASTRALGELSRLYFAGACTMSDDRMAQCFDAIYKVQYERIYEQNRDELKAVWRSPASRRKVQELRKARREGRPSDDEMTRRTEELLNPH